MVSRFIHWVSIISSLLNGITTFLKLFGAVSWQNLFVIVAIRMIVTYIIFRFIGFIIKWVLSWQIPGLLETQEEGLGRHIDYSLPVVSPVTETKDDKQRKEGVI